MPSKVLQIPTPTTTFKPDYAAGGTMVFTPSSTPAFEYIRLGKLVIFTMRAEGTTSVAPSNLITFTLPTDGSADAMSWDYPFFLAWIDDGGTELGGKACLQFEKRKTVEVQRYDGGNFCLGTVKFGVSGFYWTDDDGSITRSQLEEDVRQLSLTVKRLEKDIKELQRG